MGASYPYIVLKLGFGPNVSVVAAFFGYLALGIAFKDYNRWENNIVQTAGTAGGADRVHVRAARGVRHARREPRRCRSTSTLTPLQSFVWLTTAGLLGVLLAVPMRQHFVVDEKLTYRRRRGRRRDAHRARRHGHRSEARRAARSAIGARRVGRA